MAKKACPAGSVWDSLVNSCFPSKMETGPNYESPTELPLAVTQADYTMDLSQALWIFVLLVIQGSILALAIWFIIYKRQARLSSTSGDAERSQPEPLQKAEPPIIIHLLPSEANSHAGAHLPCHHLDSEAQTGSKWGEGLATCRNSANHAGTEGGGGLPTCSTMREHRIPLPATELGGTALVTTKTV